MTTTPKRQPGLPGKPPPDTSWIQTTEVRERRHLDRLEIFMLGAMAGAALIALIVLWAA